MGDFSCEPLKPTEIRSIKVHEPFNPCDHTDYGPSSGNAPPDFDMLELYKKAGPNIFLIQREDRDIKDPTIPPEVTLGTGFIINSPSKISSFRAMRLVNESTHTVEQYYLVPRANQPTNVDAAVLDFDNRNFFLPDAPGLPIGKSLQTGEKIIGIGYSSGGDGSYVMAGNMVGPFCSGFYELSLQCILGMRSVNHLIDARQHNEPGSSGSPELNTAGEVVGIIRGSDQRSLTGPPYATYVPIDSILPYLDGAQ